jgi:hypothetical protein
MEALNPKGRKELEEEDAIRNFLAGEDHSRLAKPAIHDH